MQLPIEFPGLEIRQYAESIRNGQKNRLSPHDSAFHDWYRFVLSFPPHLVRQYIKKFGITESQTILDPFCGTGTTLVESKLRKISAIGIEANPFAHFASSVKINWSINAKALELYANEIAKQTLDDLSSQGIDDHSIFSGIIESLKLDTLDESANKLIISNSISPLPLHKTLLLLRNLKQREIDACFNHASLALANALVFKISNLRFGPEVGVGRSKSDCPVMKPWLHEIRKMVKALNSVVGKSFSDCRAKLGDAREVSHLVDAESIDAVITSPPYPNEKDYTRTTRLESVVLGFVKDLEELRKFKKTFVRSNTRNIYKDDQDDKWIAENVRIRKLAETIEDKRIELGNHPASKNSIAR